MSVNLLSLKSTIIWLKIEFKGYSIQTMYFNQDKKDGKNCEDDK
jgi:hypothetical protein